MLYRSLGAGSFQDFWKFWNPIWSYYLAKYSFLPLKKIFPVWLSIILTFAISGALHDLAIVLLTQKLSFIITIWFSIMGAVLVSLSRLKITYTTFPLVIRGLINLGLILLSYGIAKLLLIAVDG
ncbi:acyltransferase [Aliikangiella marina]|uniref:Acyltransferase n=2 Tax=Aliikangiella marina TaxID=1712262 RepID=A0A545T1Q7_9GAMM|nr:acyltransferase [Aliikangiella marina]